MAQGPVWTSLRDNVGFALAVVGMMAIIRAEFKDRYVTRMLHRISNKVRSAQGVGEYPYNHVDKK